MHLMEELVLQRWQALGVYRQDDALFVILSKTVVDKLIEVD